MVDLFSGNSVLGFDLETTGIDVSRSRIVEYALIGSNAEGEELRVHSLVNPSIPIPAGARAVHGIRDRDVSRLPTFRAHLDAVHEALHGAVVVGHNVKRFDLVILRNEFHRLGRIPPEPVAVVDTLELVRRLGIPRPHKLGALCRRFDIGLESAHSALADASATLLVLWRLMRDQPAPFRRSLEELQVWASSGRAGTRESTLGPALEDLPTIDSQGRLRRSGDDVVFAFGRHRGATLEQVAGRDAQYLAWLKRSQSGLPAELIALIDDLLRAGRE